MGRTLASEEPDITCVAVRPGMVDTDVRISLARHVYYSNSDLDAIGASRERCNVSF